jgi:ATP-dependent DNA helicase RecG
MQQLLVSAQYIKGVGPERFKLLNKLGIQTIRDLMYHFPRRYLDRSRIKTIGEVLEEGRKSSPGILPEQTIQGKILESVLKRTRRWVSIFQIAVGDDTGIVYATWFNQPFLKEYFNKGDEVILSGKLKFYKQPFLESPEYEIIKGEEYEPLHAGRIIPCYPLTAGLNQKYLRRIIKGAVEKYSSELEDTLKLIPDKPANLLPVPEAVRRIHIPDSEDDINNARTSLVWEELFMVQMSLAERYRTIKKNTVKHTLTISDNLEQRIRQRIPFALTAAQEKVIGEMKNDLIGKYPMNRLLQGDVGSGKTIVAVYAILAAIGNHTQAALMAPTEILAEQHYQTIYRLLENSKVRISLMVSGIPRKERQEQIELIKKGGIDLVIGTHALIQKAVVFNKLSLLIIDEQHKFGVEQRETLKSKGENPHTLIMTATPIPQTLTLTLFGDLDLSVIDEMPPGRKPVKTILRPSAKMPEALEFIRQKIHEGRQVYFVYPLIDESRQSGKKSEEEKASRAMLRSATQMAKYLKAKVFPEYNIQLLHGGMKQKKKDEIMQGFRQGKTNILVSTVVIEVGIDVPNASVMVIDHAERYGLAQLHQLRGRIGRGEHNSYCLLFGDFKTPDAEKRLKIMEETNDGFRIAEEDLRIRGPGEFLGTKQSGFPELKIADLSKDLEILKAVRKHAFKIRS